MIFSSTIVLGATLGTSAGALTLCVLSLLCKHYKKCHLEGPQEDDPEKVKPSVKHSAEQFSIEKSTEPIQPETLLKFPKTYKPKPSVTSPKVIGLPSYALETTDEPSPDKAASLQPEHGILATEGTVEVPVIPRQSCTNDNIVAAEPKKSMTASSSIIHPKLHFSLRYHSQKKELHVIVIEAEHVTAEAGCEGYVSGLLTTTRTRKEAQTSMRRLATTMRWQEGLMFPLPEGSQGEGEVALSLHSWDRFSHHVILGTMRFKLADISMMCNADCWVDLQPPKQDMSASAGEILLSISYLPAANRLGVVVMKARGLQNLRLKDSIDLSVKLALRHQATKLKKKQTRHVKHKMNPVWNEMMMLEVPRELLAKSSLELEVLNLGGDGKLDLLGKCQLGLQSSGVGLQHWQQMLDNPRKQIAMWHPLSI
ncbi:synaptotagmin-13-like [Brienomyrus brachyistius]|uniref:synaptotagmin-13-like n=1 Tax=Brienomyrus brachyistius TaxID=42636 RepID=UPI0020B23ADE|nr:synaptotagmin-13-like [Brienomyrus brachyistius]